MGEISLSLEETNRLRESIGLDPIKEAPSETVDYNSHVQNNQEKGEKTKLEHRDDFLRSSSEYKKESQGFIDESNKTLDLNDSGFNYNEINVLEDEWLNKLGKHNEHAQAYPQRIPQTANEAEGNKVHVRHRAEDLSSIADKEVLTLKDTSILYDDADELENDTLVREKNTADQLKEKRKAEHIRDFGRSHPSFTDDQGKEEAESSEFLELTNGIIAVPGQQRREKEEGVLKQGQLQNLHSLISDSEEELTNRSDYSKPKKPTKMKKLKNKKNTNARRFADEEVPIVPEKVSLEIKNDDSTGVNEEDELQSFLSSSRQRSLKRSHNPDTIAEKVKRSKLEEMEEFIENAELESANKPGMVFDMTSEFLDTIGSRSSENVDDSRKAEPQDKSMRADTLERPAETENPDNPESRQKTNDTDNQPSFNGGLASTLRFLYGRSDLQKPSKQDMEKASGRREAIRDAARLKFQLSVEKRIANEELQADKNYITLPKQEKERILEDYLEKKLAHNDLTSKRDTISSQEDVLLSNYDPKVLLSYKDQLGNKLNTKEAFKYLSHRFHGTGPGRGKFMKKLKKTDSLKSNSNSGSNIL